jgi:hypothetical protein
MPDELRAIIDRNYCKHKRSAALVLFIAAVFMLILPIGVATSGNLGAAAGAGILPVGFFLPGLFMWLRYRNADSCPIGRILSERRNEIAWIYPKETAWKRQGTTAVTTYVVMIVFADKKSIELHVRQNEFQTALRLVAAEAPHALFGFNEANRAAFAQREAR